MINILSVSNMRQSDAETIRTKIPSKDLMKRAGEAIYKEVNDRGKWIGEIAIVCGTGNNAGDGYVIASLLADDSIACKLFILADKFSEDGGFYFKEAISKGVSYEFIGDEVPDFSSYSTIVDCIYGTGFHGAITGSTRSIIEAINNAKQQGTYVISVDINSGLNGDNGLADLCVNSNLTVSVGDYQPGHFLSMAKDVMEDKVNCPIGIDPIEAPYSLYEKSDVAKCLGRRKNMSNKGDYGYVALVGGSRKYSGAIRLAYLADAAMRSGAGVCCVGAPSEITDIIASHILESTIIPLKSENGELIYDENDFTEVMKHKKAIAFGMGIGRSRESAKALERLIKDYEGNLIIDADGISDLADIGSDILLDSKAKIVLTPHLKEFSRISSKSIEDIINNPIGLAKEYASMYGVIVLLKGPSTIVTDGKGVIIIDKGCAGMATAGSGDVLAGVLAAICSYGEGSILENVAAGAYINGYAGELAQQNHGAISMVASDTISMIQTAILGILS